MGHNSGPRAFPEAITIPKKKLLMRSIQWWGCQGPRIDFKGVHEGSNLVKKLTNKNIKSQKVPKSDEKSSSRLDTLIPRGVK